MEGEVVKGGEGRQRRGRWREDTSTQGAYKVDAHPSSPRLLCANCLFS